MGHRVGNQCAEVNNARRARMNITRNMLRRLEFSSRS